MGTRSAFGVEDYEAAWPEVSRRVLGGLRRRGVDADVAEEALQEAAARAWRARPTVESVDELARWTYTVALRVVIDRMRRETPIAVLQDSQDRQERDDAQPGVETTVLARLDLARALRAMRALRPADRAALATAVVAGGVGYGDRRDAVRDAVRLHRARARLLLVLGKIFGGGFTGEGARRLRLLAMPAPRAAAPAAGAAAAAAAVVVVAIALGGVHDAATPSASADPAERLSFEPAAVVAPGPGDDVAAVGPAPGDLSEESGSDPPVPPPDLPTIVIVVPEIPELPPGLGGGGDGDGLLPPLDPRPVVNPYLDLVTELVEPVVGRVVDPIVGPGVEPVAPVGGAAAEPAAEPATDAVNGGRRPDVDRVVDLALG